MSSQSPSDKERIRQAHILISEFEKNYKIVYGKKPRMNRYNLKWGMLDVIDDLGVDRAKEVLEYFFHTGLKHNLETFYKNFDKLDQNMEQIGNDRVHRAMIRRSTKHRIEEIENQ